MERWLAGDQEAELELREMQQEIRARLPVFHWMLEYPEVFYEERPDPLQESARDGAAHLDGVVGNPPFLGGRQISGSLGNPYRDWILRQHSESHGNADLVAHFFRRAADLLGQHGTLGLLATSTIAEGDTRSTSLVWLLRHDFAIYSARSSFQWPGAAAVIVASVHAAIGTPRRAVSTTRLDNADVAKINSSLRAGPERDDPVRLLANRGLTSQGSKIYGEGFILTDAERENLIDNNPLNAQRIFPYLRGAELNTNPSQHPARFVISFHDMTLEEASRWPELVDVVRSRVKPQRDKLRVDQASARVLREKWWRYQAHRPDLYAAMVGLSRCLAIPRITKHCNFVFVSSDQILNEKINVFPVESASFFAVLQSRLHTLWAEGRGSSLGTTLNYSATDCFETFPFPTTDPRSVIAALEAVGERLHDTRAGYMLETQQGLTQTYNKLKDPDCDDAPMAELRRLHEEMDRAVLDAYGWSDIEVPPYCPTTPTEEKAVEAFQDEIIDRLFVLNAERAEEERVLGLGTKKAGKSGGRKKTGKKSKTKRQASLGFDD